MAGLLLVVSLVLVALAIALARRDRARRRAAAATVSFEVDTWGVRRTLADGRHEEVAWDELVEVRVIVLPKGSWPDRVRFVLDGGGERGCVVSRDVAEDHGLIAALGRLPEFDVKALAETLDAESTGTRVVWQRAAQTST